MRELEGRGFVKEVTDRGSFSGVRNLNRVDDVAARRSLIAEFRTVPPHRLGSTDRLVARDLDLAAALAGRAGHALAADHLDPWPRGAVIDLPAPWQYGRMASAVGHRAICCGFRRVVRCVAAYYSEAGK